jgi:REP element-mobilizing transposase RayT
MSLYKNTYRIESTRLQHHDYTFAGPYAITICTKDKKHSFGEIIEGKMYLSAAGKIAEQCWSEIPKHYPTTAIDAYVIMPNHLHGIIILSDTTDKMGIDSLHGVSEEVSGGRKFGGLQAGSISSIIQKYKAAVSRLCKKQGIIDFTWQERFYDHVIRGEDGFHKVRRYINDNIAEWSRDELNIKNFGRDAIISRLGEEANQLKAVRNPETR